MKELLAFRGAPPPGPYRPAAGMLRVGLVALLADVALAAVDVVQLMLEAMGVNPEGLHAQHAAGEQAVQHDVLLTALMPALLLVFAWWGGSLLLQAAAGKPGLQGQFRLAGILFLVYGLYATVASAAALGQTLALGTTYSSAAFVVAATIVHATLLWSSMLVLMRAGRAPPQHPEDLQPKAT